MELDTRKVFSNSVKDIDFGLLRLDLYRLACVFASSKVLVDLYPEDLEHPLNELRFHFERSETGRILFQTASIIRNAWDQFPHGVEYWLDHQNTDVGVLWPNLKSPENQLALTFRESLNKIMHSIHLNYDVDKPASGPKELLSLNPYLYLYGEYNGKDWKAELDIFKFIECCVWVA